MDGPLNLLFPFLKNIFGNWDGGWAKVKMFFGNIYSLKSNSCFQGTVVQYRFLFLILTRHKFTVWGGGD
jgi:hypothetical protein